MGKIHGYICKPKVENGCLKLLQINLLESGIILGTLKNVQYIYSPQECYK